MHAVPPRFFSRSPDRAFFVLSAEFCVQNVPNFEKPMQGPVIQHAARKNSGKLTLAADSICNYLLRRVTSWAPPSTMETEETRVSFASRIRSGMLVTPTLHMVDLTLYMEASTLSCREPA